jgi:hypothetical protein
VAFRFVFKSGDFGGTEGVSLDDIQITKYDGELKTRIETQSAAYNRSGSEIDISFQTQPEFYAKKLELEVSTNGFTFKNVSNFRPTGFVTEEAQTYNYTFGGAGFDLYYFRVKSSNSDTASNYVYDFYSPIFVASRTRSNGVLGVHKVAPNPFLDRVVIAFNQNNDKETVYELFDVVGRKVLSEKVQMNSVSYELKMPNLAQGVYYLSITFGTEKPITIPIRGGNL